MNRISRVEELNKKAVELIEELKCNKVFQTLDDVDGEMYDHDHIDKGFYQKEQDKINQCLDKIMEFYYELRANLETYIAVRTFAILAEYEESGKEKTITIAGKKVKLSRAPGREVLQDASKSEVPELNWAVLYLKGWRLRAESALKTARNHTYGQERDDTKDDMREDD